MRVVCGNCETPFVFKEYEETLAARSTWEGIVGDLEAAVQEADTANEAAAVDRDRARLEVGSNGRTLERVMQEMAAFGFDRSCASGLMGGVEWKGFFRRVPTESEEGGRATFRRFNV